LHISKCRAYPLWGEKIFGYRRMFAGEKIFIHCEGKMLYSGAGR
jgi:hypothetical protein